jgi:hypothetical protein
MKMFVIGVGATLFAELIAILLAEYIIRRRYRIKGDSINIDSKERQEMFTK